MSGSNKSLQSRMLALAALNMGFGLISSAFSFYYIKVFLGVYHIEEKWFQIAQTLFMVWNAVNDPLFAYCQDSTNFKCTRTRRESVLYAAPLFAISFVIPWFPWGDTNTAQAWVTGIHLITALCFWDTMYTYVGLAACCLFAEISTDNAERLKMVRNNQIGFFIGSSSVFILQYMSNQLENFGAFQTTSIVIAIVSCLLMRYCGLNAHTEKELQDDHDMLNGKPKQLKSQQYSYITLTKQIFFNRDFLGFVIMNFFQEFHRAFLSNFFAIIGDQLISKEAITPFVRSVFYGAKSMLPNVLVIFGSSVVHKYGYFYVIRCAQVMKIMFGLIYFIIGPINHWFIMIFMLVDGCITDSVFSLFNLPLSDVADKDSVRYSRSNPVTSMVFGTNALVVKPAISLSPMLIVSILNRYGYDRLKDDTLSSDEVTTLSGVMFNLLCLFPFIIGSIQYCAWSLYTIRDKKHSDNIVIVES
ncbi:MFS/sugar transport protein [Mactra antiquata]